MESKGFVFFFWWFLPIVLFCQGHDTNYKDTKDYGFVTIECDSLGIDIWIDDMLVGQSPINSPIPLTPGIHNITYFHPEYMKLINHYYGENEFKFHVSKGFKTVYIVTNETISVHLWWSPYEKALTLRRKHDWIKTSIGILVLTSILTLNLQANF